MFELMRPMRAKIDAKIKEVVFAANWLGDESDDDATAQTKAKSKTKERGGRVAPVEIDEAHYLQPFGMMSFPVITKTTRMFSFFDGPHALVAWVWDSAKAIVDLVSGETRLFSVGNIATRLRLTSDDKITAEAASILLGASATKGAARVDDTTTNGSLVITSAANALTFTYTPPGGSPQVTTIGFVISGPSIVVTNVVGGTATLTGVINSGSAKTKVE